MPCASGTLQLPPTFLGYRVRHGSAAMKPSFTACALCWSLLTSTVSAEWMRNADGEIWLPLNVAPSRDIDATTGPFDPSRAQPQRSSANTGCSSRGWYHRLGGVPEGCSPDFRARAAGSALMRDADLYTGRRQPGSRSGADQPGFGWTLPDPYAYSTDGHYFRESSTRALARKPSALVYCATRHAEPLRAASPRL